MRRRLEAYYSLVAPDQLDDGWLSRLDQIYAKYGGSDDGEQRLATKLAKKYGSTVRLLTVQEHEKRQQQQQGAAPAAAVAPDEEDSFQLREAERNSGVLDLTSQCFDPVAALQSSMDAVCVANPWFQEQPVQLLDRVEQCRPLLPPSDPLYRPLTTRPRQARSIEFKRKVRPPSVLASLGVDQGPLAVLQAALADRRRVRIVTRYVDGVRSTLTGYLLAYDKHWNVLLRDAEEVYTRRQVLAGSNVEREVARRLTAIHDRSALRQRHLPQLLVRGDNIVMIYFAEGEQSAFGGELETQYRARTVRRNVPLEERVPSLGSLRQARAIKHRSKSR